MPIQRNSKIDIATSDGGINIKKYSQSKQKILQSKAFKCYPIEKEVGYIREKLPVFFPNSNKIKLWKTLKDFIGKDLTKVSLPVTFNEPLSFL